MKKNDNKIDIELFCIIAEKDNLIFKQYFVNYEKFQKELKYYVYLGYHIQVMRINRELIV